MKTFIKISYYLTWFWIILLITLMFTLKTEYLAFILGIIITFFCGKTIKIFQKLYDEDTKETPNN